MIHAVQPARDLRCHWAADDEAFGRAADLLDRSAAVGWRDYAEGPWRPGSPMMTPMIGPLRWATERPGRWHGHTIVAPALRSSIRPRSGFAHVVAVLDWFRRWVLEFITI
jgi:hypothetical protein